MYGLEEPNMNWLFRLGLSVCFGALIGFGAGCSDDPDNTTDGGPDGSPPPGGGEIHIGVLAPISGKAEQWGKASKTISEMAVEEINAAGGVLGKKIVLDIADTGTEGAAEAEAKKMVDNPKILAIAGPLTSGDSNKAMPLIKGKVVAVSQSAASPALSEADDGGFFFRTAPSDAYQGVAAAKYAVETLKAKKASIAYIDNAYGEGLATAFAESFKGKGGTVLATVKYPDQEDYAEFDFSKQAGELFAGGPEIVFLVTFNSDGTKLVSAIKTDPGYDKVKATVKFLGTDGNGSADFAGGADPTVVDNKMWGTMPGALTDDPNYQKFAAAYRAKFKLAATVEPDPYMDSKYDAIYTIAYAIQNAGKEDRAAIKDSMMKVTKSGTVINVGEWAKGAEAAKAGEINYQGASGPIDFDDKGDCVPANFFIWVIKGGKVEIVEKKYSYQ
jgi:ABC-type branched-subunit amino acid transport system substrate-binding protein